MLTITIDLQRIDFEQDRHLATGNRTGHLVAQQISGMKKAFEWLSRDFNRKQMRNVRFHDARPETLLQIDLNPIVKSGAGIFEGLHKDSFVQAGQGWLMRLDDGPRYDREYANLTMLAYFDEPANTLAFLWIGLESDVAQAQARLIAELTPG